ncbi:peroxisomal targeting signal 2 receptor-like isoform X2 [Dinothrombium tinctorium]|uniref:Peroxin-7 n=1 Tax=Dinothrombium tinctorium TaxID=1965070 RepID=A0A3S3P8E1_9ACAR|nr:peroxisomal targeting signal 2 receptor-like isoform X2 [Dinothrombium tinctorium]RWS17178.1 peroxisomal targeting signal 2 receptor-like isoform X2 [Dinothrombium tinctorium]
MMSVFETEDYHGYNVKFSPFAPCRVACAASQNYGLKGIGSVYVIDFFTDENVVQLYTALRWPDDGLFDLTWSEVCDHILWSASGDGFIQIWNILQTSQDFSTISNPIQVIKAHSKEIYAIEWSLIRCENPSVLTASWDHLIKQWDGVTAQCMRTFTGSESIVYDAAWSPQIPSTFASASGDGFLRIYDAKESPEIPFLAFRVNEGEALSCDWCKYNEFIIATGGTDGLIRVWDTRYVANGPVSVLQGHHRAVKKVKFSPHSDSIVASVSYDFTTKIWDFKLGLNPVSNPLLMTFQNHREFVYGLDFNLHVKDQLADCGWDKLVKIFTITPFAPLL